MNVPPTTAIKRSRVGNIDTDRLRARRLFLAVLIKQYSRTFEARVEFVSRCAELAVIERELVKRDELCPTKMVTA
jgi:hypothetical protein